VFQRMPQGFWVAVEGKPRAPEPQGMLARTMKKVMGS